MKKIARIVEEEESLITIPYIYSMKIDKGTLEEVEGVFGLNNNIFNHYHSVAEGVDVNVN